MIPEKLKAVVEFKKYLQVQDIGFTEHANGQFNLYNDDKLIYTVWVTTGKVMRKPSDEVFIGIDKLKKELYKLIK